MGGTCIGSFILPRVISPSRNPLRVYAAIEISIGILGVLVLALMPFAGRIYFAGSGYGLPGFLLRGIVAAMCLLPPTLLMGATLPVLARRVKTTSDSVSWLGFIYGANIGGAVIGCLLPGFYLLREYDVTTTTIAGAAINAVVACVALMLSSQDGTHSAPALSAEVLRDSSTTSTDTLVYVVIGLSGLCALATEPSQRERGLLLEPRCIRFHHSRCLSCRPRNWQQF
jgi:spermidine synthase